MAFRCRRRRCGFRSLAPPISKHSFAAVNWPLKLFVSCLPPVDGRWSSAAPSWTFGCGCGRVLRQWKDLAGTTLYGTDLNTELVEWCRERLPFASVSVNSSEPPTSFADERFDAIYAFSIFTHMPADIQKRWLQEFRRILKPGGLLIFSTHGSYYLRRLSHEDRQRFLDGKPVARFASATGSNLCSTYHPETFVRRELAPGWEIAAFAPEGARGNPCQDAWVFRRP
jgi:SAM-dependent methyltransferase